MKIQIRLSRVAAMWMSLSLLAGQTADAVTATGGNITNDVAGYRIHIFTNDGAFAVQDGGLVRVLVVGGGGGGGGGVGGGGGAGGLVYEDTYPVVAGENIAVTVGGGGPGGTGGWYGSPQNGTQGANGGDSIFGMLTAKGGGGGGAKTSNGLDGGSGGGCGYTASPGSAVLDEAQGRDGGTASGTGYYHASGGGGAGTAGSNATASVAGNGGDGLQFDISGTPTWYAGGGGGGRYFGTSLGTGGLGGGGNGGTNGDVVAPGGTACTGGGGGGQGNEGPQPAGNGGSGVVIVKYLQGSAVGGGGSEPRQYPVDQWVSVSSNDAAAFRTTDRLEAKCRHAGEPNWPITRGFFRFDIAGLTAGSAVTSAVVWLYLDETGSPNDYEIYGAQLRSVNAAWSNSAPVLYNQATVLLTNFAKSTPATYIPPAPGWYKVDVTPAVSNWQTGAASNCGFMVRVEQEGGYDGVIRGFDILGSRAPRLVVKAADAPAVRYVTTNVTADGYRTVFSDGTTRTDEIRCGNITTTTDNPRGYFRFTLPDMPLARYRLVGAGLRLYVSEITSPSYAGSHLYRVTTPWATNDVEYGESMTYLKEVNREGGVDPASRSTGWLPFELRDTVQAWVNGSATNHGFCFRADEGAYTYTLRRASPTGTYAPILTLTFEELSKVGGTFIMLY